MRGPIDLRGKWVLVVGASSGLGHSMSHVVARDYGGNLVLAARRRTRLVDLANTLRAQYGVEAVPCQTDLQNPADVERLVFESTSGRSLRGVLLNAGVTYYGRHCNISNELSDAIITTNLSSIVALTECFVKYFSQQPQGGGLLLVSSLASFLPLPYQALYGASKAFVTSFAHALREEIRETNVSITVFAPGGIATEMLEYSGLDKRFNRHGIWVMPAQRCAKLAVRAFVRRKSLAIPGVLNKLTYAVIRVTPRALVTRMAAMLYRVQ
ncbi:MAG: SDR family NAD(P)-dependent oxidoreductase [Pirellulaceae bacterium]